MCFFVLFGGCVFWYLLFLLLMFVGSLVADCLCSVWVVIVVGGGCLFFGVCVFVVVLGVVLWVIWCLFGFLGGVGSWFVGSSFGNLVCFWCVLRGVSFCRYLGVCVFVLFFVIL